MKSVKVKVQETKRQEQTLTNSLLSLLIIWLNSLYVVSKCVCVTQFPSVFSLSASVQSHKITRNLKQEIYVQKKYQKHF